MTKHAAAAIDEHRISPKVIAVAVVGGVLTVAASFLASIPPEALEDLGLWALPVGSAITTGSAVLAAWAKADPARKPSVYVSDRGDVYTHPSTIHDGDGNYTGEVDIEAAESAAGYTSGDLVLTEDEVITDSDPGPEPEEVHATRDLTPEEVAVFEAELKKRLG